MLHSYTFFPRRFTSLLGNWKTVWSLLAVASGLLNLELKADEPVLAFKSVSPAGNLLMEVRGQAGISVVIELSTSLNHWIPSGNLVLTNGTASFYFRPTENQRFCRVKAIANQDAPAPASFAPTPSRDFLKSAWFDDEAGNLTLRDDNGFSYDLTLAEDSLMNPSTISLQVVNESAGLPPGLTYLGGAIIEPIGLDVYSGCTLSITPARGMDTNTLAVIAWETGGTELHLVPFRFEGAQVVIPIHRLGGFGLVQLNGGNINPLVKSKPTDSSSQFDHELGILSLPPGAFRQQREASHSKQGELPCSQAAAWQIFLTARLNELQNAISDDTLLESALHNFSPVDALDAAASQPCFAPILALVDTCDSLALTALMKSIEHEAELCRVKKDIKALVRLYRDGRLLLRGHWTKKATPEQIQRMKDLFHECMHFRVEILSSTAAGSKGGTVRTSVSSSINVQLVHASSPAGASKLFRLSGDAEITIDSTAWDNLNTLCSASPAPTSGHVAVEHLAMEGLSTDVKNLIIRTDDELPTPKFQLSFDPFLPPPSENYILECPPTAPLRMASFWGAIYGGLHRNEIKKSAKGKSVFVVDGFRMGANGEPFRKGYLWEGNVDAMNASETTTLLIHYTGAGE